MERYRIEVDEAGPRVAVPYRGAQLLSHSMYNKSTAFTREERHREMARQMGAVWAGAADEDPGVPLEAAVNFAPAGDLVPLALERLDRGGTLAINAIHMSPIPSFEYERLYGERTVRSVMNFTRRDAEEFLELAARIPVRAETEVFPLEEANEALLRIKRGEVRGAAVLLTS